MSERNNIPAPTWVTPAQASRILGVSGTRTHQLMHSGKLETGTWYLTTMVSMRSIMARLSDDIQ